MNADAVQPKQSSPFYKSLFIQVIFALVLGIILGMATPAFATGLKFFSDAFLKLISMLVAPILIRHRAQPDVRGFVKGAYAAAIGTILGACILLGRIAIGDWLTVAIGISSLAVLFRWKVSNPLLITATAFVGLIAFPLLQPTWVMVK